MFISVSLPSLRRILKVLAVIFGEDEGLYICIPSSTVHKVFERLSFEGWDRALIDLVNEGLLKVQRFGRGSRLCIRKDDELVKIRDFIFSPERVSSISLEEFERLFDDALTKLKAGSVTGFVDLGRVRDFLMRNHGIPEDMFVKYVSKLIMSKRWKYAICHGGSLRLKIGGVQVGLVKLVRR